MQLLSKTVKEIAVTSYQLQRGFRTMNLQNNGQLAGRTDQRKRKKIKKYYTHLD